MPVPQDALQQALVERFEIESVLGSGGMATVFLAYDLRHGRRVAIKVLRPEIAELLGNIVSSGRSLSWLSSPTPTSFRCTTQGRQAGLSSS